MKTKAKARKTRVMGAKERLAELKAFVNLCFASAEEGSLTQLANRSGLSVATIYRLASGEFTLAVHFGTVQALGLAVGLQLVMTETEARIVVTSR